MLSVVITSFVFIQKKRYFYYWLPNAQRNNLTIKGNYSEKEALVSIIVQLVQKERNVRTAAYSFGSFQ